MSALKSPFVDSCKDWLYTVVVGFLAVTYWRSTWVLFDIWLCKQPDSASLAGGDSFCFLVDAGLDPDTGIMRRNSAFISYGIGIGLLIIGLGLMWSGLWLPANATGSDVEVTPLKAVIRFITVYILGGAAVNMWRAVWYLTDFYLLPTLLDENGLPLVSYWVSSVVGSTVSFMMCAGGALLATPAIFLIDGPGIHPPPLAVTIASTYFSLTLRADEKPPKLSIPVILLDTLMSFIALPIFVVMYWRGSWMLLDYYLWGLTPEVADVRMSIVWGTVLAVPLMFLTSETIVARLPVFKTRLVSECFNRLRTYILAWGTVSFWRVVWYIWDEFIGGPAYWSAWTGHAVAVILLTVFGCLSCITAPPATLGVDAVPNPDAAEEPLFAMLPVPYEKLHLFGIGRKPVSEQALWDAAQKHLADIADGKVESPDEGALQAPPPPIPRGRSGRSQGDAGEIEMGSVSKIQTYYEIQRPGLDHRLSVSVGSSIRSSAQGAALGASIRSSGTARRNSSFCRNR